MTEVLLKINNDELFYFTVNIYRYIDTDIPTDRYNIKSKYNIILNKNELIYCHKPKMIKPLRQNYNWMHHF